MTSARLRLEALTVARGGVTVLHGAGLDLPPGGCHALIGPNGAGKSTLLMAVTGALRPGAGRILLDGADVGGLPPHRVARLGVARTWQHPAVCTSLTAAQNLTLALRIRGSAAARQLNELLAGAGLAERGTTLAGQLSYGQQRRLELAVALARQPRLLVLDEPSAGLSDADVEQLLRQIRSGAERVSVLLAEHNLDFVAALADQVSVLDSGRILATGTLDQVMGQPATHAVFPRGSGWPAAPPPAGGNGQAPLLAVRRLTAGHGAAPVLRDLAFDLYPGTVTAVVGDPGTGKSTLLQAIAGLVAVSASSRILIGGQPVHDATVAQRGKCGLAFVPQDRRLFAGLSVEEHLRVAVGVRWSAVEAALPAALRERRRRKAATLSGGQQQLLAVVLALLRRPRVVLLDEPFEGLSSATIDDVWRLLDTVVRVQGGAALVADQRGRATEAGADAVLTLPGLDAGRCPARPT